LREIHIHRVISALYGVLTFRVEKNRCEPEGSRSERNLGVVRNDGSVERRHLCRLSLPSNFTNVAKHPVIRIDTL
jgi:hypothetical protein